MNAINCTNIFDLHTSRGHSGSCAPDGEAQLTLSTSHNSDRLTNLMNEIASRANLILAFKAVKRNKGAPGVDNMTVTEVAENLDIILEELNLALINHSQQMRQNHR
jgi:retron-type reverse transcriptase